MRLRSLFAGAAAAATLTAQAQSSPAVDPDWREADVPPPPALVTQGLVPLEVARATLRFGIDPASVAIGPDLIVRYVVVAQSPSGVTTGIYEGLNCSTGEVKVFARHNPDRGWLRAGNEKWVPLHDGLHAGYSLVIARQGACLGSSPNRPAERIVRDLAEPYEHRFRSETHR